MRVLLLILTAAIAYYLGSLNGAIIAARFVFHKDVRNYGSGNAGLTNYYRSLVCRDWRSWRGSTSLRASLPSSSAVRF